ncbi:MAG: dTMP kinase [Caldiserica bacterium]|nr:MAG: dTMP kinase [Caldisericota bacterium]
MKGLFITFEGIDGSGKSTQAMLLKDRFNQLNRPVVFTKEPGGTPLGKKIREILLNDNMNPVSEFLLFAADRKEHAKKIIVPSLSNGKIVISDRFADSSVAYQGFGRGVPIDFINFVHQNILSGLKPDLTFIVDISPEIGLRRLAEKDRIERGGINFLRKVREGYLELAGQDKRFVVIDGTVASEKVANSIWEFISRWEISNG